MGWEEVSCPGSTELSQEQVRGHPGVIWHQREGAIHFLYIVISTMTMATLWRSGPSPGELYRDTTYYEWLRSLRKQHGHRLSLIHI